MTQSRHIHEPFSKAHIVSDGDFETSTCYACWSPINRFWVHDDYDVLPFATEWELTK